LRWVESEKLAINDSPDVTPVIPPEIPSKKEATKPSKKPVKSARKLQQPQIVVLPPQKPPIRDSTEAARPEHRGAIRAVSACAAAVA
jgi:hypothetical protein